MRSKQFQWKYRDISLPSIVSFDEKGCFEQCSVRCSRESFYFRLRPPLYSEFLFFIESFCDLLPLYYSVFRSSVQGFPQRIFRLRRNSFHPPKNLSPNCYEEKVFFLLQAPKTRFFFAMFLQDYIKLSRQNSQLLSKINYISL